MDATIFATNFGTIDRTKFYPASGEVLDGTWCRKIANTQIRAAGWSGKILFAPGAQALGQTLKASGSVSLPFNAFGSTYPPMVYVMPQYGSVVIYKQFQAENRSFYQSFVNPSMTNVPSWIFPKFRTWITQLSYSVATIGGVVGFSWGFTVNHEATPAGDLRGLFTVNSIGFKAPYLNMMRAWYPEFTTGTFALHWYALGVRSPNGL